VAEVGQRRVCAVGVVIDAFGPGMPDEYQFHGGERTLWGMRPTWCEIDVSVISHNVKTLSARLPGVDICAVVKADAYTHGAIPVAHAAIEAGASWLAVALVEEGVQLRNAGIDAPILVLSEPSPSGMLGVVFNRLTPTLYTAEGVRAAGEAARSAGINLDVEVSVDTGMRRVGAEPDEVMGVIESVISDGSLTLGGVWTHCAVADELENDFTQEQFDRFDRLLEKLHVHGGEAIRRHAGNSAVAIAHEAHSYDMVRCGIAMYGVDPSAELHGRAQLKPALSLHSKVSFVKHIDAGDGVGYGHHWHAPSDRWLATVPIGYADGVRRDLGLRGGEVLINGLRRPIVGVVTMDQLMVDLGDDSSVTTGDEVVLLGPQGDDVITAAEIAELLDTIPYEVLCAIGPRVSRTYV